MFSDVWHRFQPDCLAASIAAIKTTVCLLQPVHKVSQNADAARFRMSQNRYGADWCLIISIFCRSMSFIHAQRYPSAEVSGWWIKVLSVVKSPEVMRRSARQRRNTLTGW